VPKHLAAKTKVEFWGKEHTVKPAVARGFIGDGKTLLYFTPLATRPNWYLIRVDSLWGRWTDDTDGHDHIDEVIDRLEKEFHSFESEVEYLEQDGLTPEEIERDHWDELYFPVLHLDCGYCWGVEARHDGRVWRKKKYLFSEA
jgi:hypothetical protein